MLRFGLWHTRKKTVCIHLMCLEYRGSDGDRINNKLISLLKGICSIGKGGGGGRGSPQVQSIFDVAMRSQRTQLAVKI